MKKRKCSTRFLHVALVIVILTSAALAQHGPAGGNGQRGEYSKPLIKPTIVNPRTSTASPMISSLNVAGPWTDDYGYVWSLNQDQAGNITGSVNVPCPVPVWTVSGAVTSNTQFTITATDPDGGDGFCNSWFQYTMTMSSGTSASGTWNNSVPQTGTVTMTGGEGIVLIDPVASNLLDGNEVTEDTDAIAAVTNPKYVSGAAADGVTQVIVEVTGVQAGDSVQLTLVNENGEQDSAANDGGLIPLGGDPDNASSTLTVTAQDTMAIAVWRAPTNYNRNAQGVTTNPQDFTTVQRSLTLQAQDTSTDGSLNTVSKIIWAVRPPVVLIHGIWSSGQGTWGLFSPANQQNFTLWAEMNPQAVDYSAPVQVTATTPSYPSLLLPLPNQLTQAALGFSYNAPGVLKQLNGYIQNYEIFWNVAAVQADVVAHSMGGDIARVMPSVTTGPAPFLSQSNYGLGPVHKLITIGTPHLGMKVASDLLPSGSGDPNYCVRDFLALAHDVSLQTATINGTPVNGAVADLQLGVSGSQPFPIAYIAGSTIPANLSKLDSYFSASSLIYNACWTGLSNPLAFLLTPTSWNYEFSLNGSVQNDGIVPVTSQLGGTSSTLVFPGVIHSPGFESLNFSPPSEVDPASGIPDEVINLLNEQTNGSDFFWNN